MLACMLASVLASVLAARSAAALHATSPCSPASNNQSTRLIIPTSRSSSLHSKSCKNQNTPLGSDSVAASCDISGTS